MARAKPRFSILDVQRAMSGAQKAGFVIARCDIKPDGTISVVTLEGARLDAYKSDDGVNSELTPLERWRAKRDARNSETIRTDVPNEALNAKDVVMQRLAAMREQQALKEED